MIKTIKFNLRVPSALYQQARTIAQKKGMSVNALFVLAIRIFISGHNNSTPDSQKTK